MEEIRQRLNIDSILKFLIIMFILFVSFIVVISIIKREFYTEGIVAGILFTFFLILIKWIIKETGI